MAPLNHYIKIHQRYLKTHEPVKTTVFYVNLRMCLKELEKPQKVSGRKDPFGCSKG